MSAIPNNPEEFFDQGKEALQRVYKECADPRMQDLEAYEKAFDALAGLILSYPEISPATWSVVLLSAGGAILETYQYAAWR